jgi:hypothetical protein
MASDDARPFAIVTRWADLSETNRVEIYQCALQDHRTEAASMTMSCGPLLKSVELPFKDVYGKKNGRMQTMYSLRSSKSV